MLIKKSICVIFFAAIVAERADTLQIFGKQNHRRSQTNQYDLQNNHPYLGDRQAELVPPPNVNDIEPHGSSSVSRSRHKRAGMYVWPIGSEFVAEFSFEVPMFSPDNVVNIINWEQDFEFILPNGTSKLFYKRSIEDRLDVYSRMEQLFNLFGYDGQACVFKAICEKAEHNFFRGGVLGDIFDVLLTVSHLNGHESSMLEYAEAEAHGQAEKSCVEKYSTCDMSLFHIFEYPY